MPTSRTSGEGSKANQNLTTKPKFGKTGKKTEEADQCDVKSDGPVITMRVERYRCRTVNDYTGLDGINVMYVHNPYTREPYHRFLFHVDFGLGFGNFGAF